MLIYYVIPGLILVARLLAGKKKINWVAFYLFSALLILWVGFRFHVGCDWTSYIHYGEQTAYLSWGDAAFGRDPLFHLTIKLLTSLGIPYYPGINVFTAIVFFAGAASLATLARDRLSFLYYLYPVAIVVTAMSGVRQAIAIGILMFAFRQIVKRRFISFIVLVLLAAGFHGSAFLFIILWPIMSQMRLSRKLAVIAISSIPTALAFAASNTVDVAIDRYTATELEAFGSAFRLGLLAAAGAVFFVLLRSRWREAYPSTYPIVQFTMYGNLALLALLFVRLPGVSSVIFDRIGLYLVPVTALMQAVAPDIAKPRDRRIITVLFYALYLLFFVMWSTLSRKFAGCYVPYSSYLWG